MTRTMTLAAFPHQPDKRSPIVLLEGEDDAGQPLTIVADLAVAGELYAAWDEGEWPVLCEYEDWQVHR